VAFDAALMAAAFPFLLVHYPVADAHGFPRHHCFCQTDKHHTPVLPIRQTPVPNFLMHRPDRHEPRLDSKYRAVRDWGPFYLVPLRIGSFCFFWNEAVNRRICLMISDLTRAAVSSTITPSFDMSVFLFRWAIR